MIPEDGSGNHVFSASKNRHRTKSFLISDGYDLVSYVKTKPAER